MREIPLPRLHPPLIQGIIHQQPSVQEIIIYVIANIRQKALLKRKSFVLAEFTNHELGGDKKHIAKGYVL